MIQELRNKNELLLKSVNKNEDLYIRLVIIKKILLDEKCFFKMNIDDAYNILLDLGYSKEEALNAYKKLISFDSFEN